MLTQMIKSSKKDTLINLLSKTDKRRNYSLYLVSCYFTAGAAKKIINELGKVMKFSEVNVYIDRKSAYKAGKIQLNEFCSSFNNLTVNFFAVDTIFLFHTKTYALISYDQYNSIYGILVAGSANLTESGLTSNSGNIESLFDTQDSERLREFTSQIEKLKTLSIDEIDKFKDAKDFNFKYALLCEGIFVHKWTDDLGKYLSIRYELNENGKQKIGDPAFKNVGFDIDTASISKRYFDFDYEPRLSSEQARNITRNYGIENHLGHWLPICASEILLDTREFNDFKTKLKNQLLEQIEYIKRNIQNDFNDLKESDIIKSMDFNPAESFEKKVESLLENECRLKRIFSKYETFELPYGLEQKDDINKLFKDMVLLSESSLKKNKAMRAFLQCIESVDITNFQETIRNHLKNDN